MMVFLKSGICAKRKLKMKDAKKIAVAVRLMHVVKACTTNLIFFANVLLNGPPI